MPNKIWPAFLGRFLRAPFRQASRRPPAKDPEVGGLFFANWTTLSPGALSSPELRDAVLHVSYPAQAYHIRAFRGLQRVENVEVLWFPESRRAGISWRGRTYWQNAPGPKEAVRYWKRKARNPADDRGGSNLLLP